MATQNTDFLKFSAYSMKELITRKLSEDSKFTDQVYEGSNLAILIDLVAYMYQVIVYQLNNAAAESMFSDTQIYENISRLVKLIGYNPKGFKPSSIRVNMIQTGDNGWSGKKLLKYSQIDTGLTDSRGEKIYFSLPRMGSTGNGGSILLESEDIQTVTLYNGKWKLYPTIFTASGTEYETFTLSQIKSDSDQNKYVADGFIDVYVKRGGSFGQDFQYNLDSEELLLGMSTNTQATEGMANRLYNSQSRVFSLRLNENKEYEIKFGDGTTGKKLEPGDQLYIFYLDTNGPDGEIDIADIDFTNLKFEHNPSIFGLNGTDYDSIFGGKEIEEALYSLNPYSMTVSKSKPEQSVEDIKQHAPQWFKTGNRLLTRSDYEFFVKSSIPQVIDVKCMNNWEYLATFYKWLYDCGVRYHSEVANPGHYYFDEARFTRNGMDMVDAADANNIYLWVKTDDNFTIDNVKSTLKDSYNMDGLKIITSEIQFQKPIPVLFDICAGYQDIALRYAHSGNSDFDDFVAKATMDSYLEITIDDDSLYVNSYIVNRVQSIFNKYFNMHQLTISQNINITDILDEIYSIAGVQRVRTVFQPSFSYLYSEASEYAPRAIDGISMISWTNGFIDYGEDVQIGNSSRHIMDFQFPEFNGNVADRLSGRIKVIKKQLTKIGNIKF